MQWLAKMTTQVTRLDSHQKEDCPSFFSTYMVGGWVGGWVGGGGGMLEVGNSAGACMHVHVLQTLVYACIPAMCLSAAQTSPVRWGLPVRRPAPTIHEK
jgi:hypothetical protein